MTDDDALTHVLAGWYRAPEATIAAQALAHAVRAADLARRPDDDALVYLFVRIARASADARALFAALGPTLDADGARVVARINAAASDPRFADPLARPPARPADLDLLWADFLVTGELEAVRRIVQVLDRPDGFRARLEQWLAKKALGLFARADAAVERDVAGLRALGVAMDVRARAVTDARDLDCVYAAALRAQACAPSSLPIAFDAAALLQIAMKGAALWSLGSNAQQHPAVAALCEVESAQPGGRARRMLVDPRA